MEERQKFEGLPGRVREYIGELVRRVRYRRRVRGEVRRELTDHFVDALGDCESEEDRKELGEKLVAEFGEAKVLAKLGRKYPQGCSKLVYSRVKKDGERKKGGRTTIGSVDVFGLCDGREIWLADPDGLFDTAAGEWRLMELD